jgi:aminotransferase
MLSAALSLSKKATFVTQSEIRAMSLECEKIGGINLAQGVCDTAVALEVRQGAQRAIDLGLNSYSRFDGIPELRSSIGRKMWEYNIIRADPETEIVVSAGSTGSFYCACLALLNPGDEVIVFEPYYGYHINTLMAVEAVPSFVTLQSPDWTFEIQDLEKALTPRTRGIVINSPANPSGKVFSRAELECIADFSNRHDLLVFTDEIYEYFLYDGRFHISTGSLAGMAKRTVTISGFSKTFSITGWRIGYSVCRADWAEMIGRMNDLVYVCAPVPLQAGVAAGIAGLGPQFYSALRTEYTAKRERICQALLDVGLTPCVPQGAYYVLADVSRLPGKSSKQKAMHLLARTGVATVPGEAFFHSSQAERFVRFCFAKSDEQLEEAVYRLRVLA